MYNAKEARDCLRGASSKRVSNRLLIREWTVHSDNGAPMVVSEWESHLHGEEGEVIGHLKDEVRVVRNAETLLTPGSNGETVDGKSMEKINAVIELVRNEGYRWTPVKRVYFRRKCHHNLHSGKTYLLTGRNQLPESRDAVKAARSVRRRNDGKEHLLPRCPLPCQPPPIYCNDAR